MELKEFAKQVFDLFSVDENKSLSEAVMEVLFCSRKEDIYDKYMELAPDLSIDMMQKIYQFYYAERKEKKQDYTPVCLSRLLSFLTFSNEESVYDCCSGSGSLLIQKWNTNKELSFICEELDERVIPLLLFNLSLRNIVATVTRKNVLTGEVMDSYVVEKGEKYGYVHRFMFPNSKETLADTSVCNPPFNLKTAMAETITQGMPANTTCNFGFVNYCLSRCKRHCVVILPLGCLTSQQDAACRKYFWEKGWLKAAITMPEKMFESTDVATCVLFFDKKKTSSDVMIVDASGMKSVEVREQRGEGDASHYNRIYKKVFNTFTDEQLWAVVNLVEKEMDKYSMRIDIKEAGSKKYNLTLGPYLPIEMEGTIHRDFNEIISDINRVIRERNVIKVTVNKLWAQKLGLDQVIKDCEMNNEIVKAINISMSNLKNYKVKEKILENKYISSSNSKVFLIENTDKEILSSIMPFFMGMYKQHIYYLNNEENRLLAELRDAMLPFLMNGMLQVG